MDQSERERLLKRVRRQGATVGARMPETVTIRGEDLDLDEFIVETRRVEGVPPEAAEVVAEATRSFRAAREERFERLKHAEMERAKAEALAEEIIGIDRALNALEGIRRPAYAEDASHQQIEDYKRWLGFLDAVR
jgi:hypothetical protein